MFSTKKLKAGSLALAAALLASVFLGGCGAKQQKAAGAAQVKAMKVLQQDTPLTTEYAGQVRDKNEVKVQARVSGNVVEKYVKGGEYVQAGQPLYKIDSRQYESKVLSAQATLSQSEATLNNAQTDLSRDQQLLNADAISEQTVTTQQSNVSAYQSAADANAALLRKAQQDLDDTVVYAPMSGKLAVDDVAVGTYATAGNTALVTLGSESPVYVQFSVSETEYLKMVGLKDYGEGHGDMTQPDVTITLSNGKEYPYSGRLVEADRALAENTGTLTVKALFDNPDGMLLPGMFARVKLSGETVPNAILVPQRAVQQLLGKSFVIVVGDDGKSQTKVVKMGTKVGSYVIIEDGLSAEDTVVVEGLTNLQEGKDLAVTMVTPEEMGFSLTSSSENVDASSSASQS